MEPSIDRARNEQFKEINFVEANGYVDWTLGEIFQLQSHAILLQKIHVSIGSLGDFRQLITRASPMQANVLEHECLQ